MVLIPVLVRSSGNPHGRKTRLLLTSLPPASQFNSTRNNERREERTEEGRGETHGRVICSVSPGGVGYECPKAEATLVLATVNVNILRSPH